MSNDNFWAETTQAPTTPFPVLQDRRLTQQEQIQLWNDLMRPDAPKDDVRDREMVQRYGFLFNRLDFDREWCGDEHAYRVPDFCQPGAKRLGRAKIARVRREMQGIPPIGLSDAMRMLKQREADPND